MGNFPSILGGISFEKAGKLYGRGKPIFFDKTQIAASLAICLSHTLSFPKRTTKGRGPLETSDNVGAQGVSYYAVRGRVHRG